MSGDVRELRQRQRAVGTLLVAAGLALLVAGALGVAAVLVVVLLAQAAVVVFGRALLPASDRWVWAAVVPGPVAAVLLTCTAGGVDAFSSLAPGAVLAAAFGCCIVIVLLTELGRASVATAGAEPAAAGQGRVERLSQNLTVAVFALGPVFALPVRLVAAGSVKVGVDVAVGPAGDGDGRRWWLALAVALAAAGIGVRLGGSIVRAAGLSIHVRPFGPHAAAVLRGSLTRAVGVDALVSVAAGVLSGAVVRLTGIPTRSVLVPALLAVVATLLVLAAATTVLGLRARVRAGVLAAGLGLALSAPVALLLAVHPG